MADVVQLLHHAHIPVDHLHLVDAVRLRGLVQDQHAAILVGVRDIRHWPRRQVEHAKYAAAELGPQLESCNGTRIGIAEVVANGGDGAEEVGSKILPLREVNGGGDVVAGLEPGGPALQVVLKAVELHIQIRELGLDGEGQGEAGGRAKDDVVDAARGEQLLDFRTEHGFAEVLARDQQHRRSHERVAAQVAAEREHCPHLLVVGELSKNDHHGSLLEDGRIEVRIRTQIRLGRDGRQARFEANRSLSSVCADKEHVRPKGLQRNVTKQSIKKALHC
mmetsp:Transcript_60188/g.172897  ORF Transcript_60188/g.172897 Transcript_60188/m.172897 type:complete len:277 (-) Transcript_60188:50-880(-)